jgi:hypothetical protein
MKRRKRRYYDAYSSVKSHQSRTRLVNEVVESWEVDDLCINPQYHRVNGRMRSRVGYIQKNGKDSK